MRIGFISDLHVDLLIHWTRQDLIKMLLEVVEEKAADLLIIAGDISNNYLTTIAFIEELQALSSISIWFIPGNHDCWSNDLDTWLLYQRYCDHPNCLMERPLILNDQWALIGHSAWYNHAGSYQVYSEEFLQAGYFQGYHWMDKQNTCWHCSDRQVSSLFANKIQADFERVDRPNYILVTHFVSDLDLQIQPNPKYQNEIDYFNAFISTDDLLPLYKQYPIRYAIMGHVHQRRTIKKPACTYQLVCLGTEREWSQLDLKQEIKQALSVIEI